jgi:hypothetical protein
VESYVQAGKLMEKAIRRYGPVPVVPTALEPVFVDEPGSRSASIEDTGEPLMAPLSIPQRYEPPPGVKYFGPLVEGWHVEAYYATEKTTVEPPVEGQHNGKTFVLRVYGKLGHVFYRKIWELKKK